MTGLGVSARGSNDSWAGQCAHVEAQPLPANMGALLDRAVARFGDRPAWIFMETDEADLTYAELGAMVARTAAAFASIGVGKGTHVGIMLPNVPLFLAGWLALARIGAVLVPINPSYSPDELYYMHDDGDLEYLLIDHERLPTLHAMEDRARALPKSHVMIWGAPAPAGYRDWNVMYAAAEASFTPADPVHIDDVVNIQYTSGSTGFPKGCILPHRYWLQYGMIKALLWPRVERIQCDLPFHYMGPLWRFAMAAYQGAALCVPPAYSLTRFVERLRRYRIDFSWMTDPVGMLTPVPEEADNCLKLIASFGMSPDIHLDVERRFKVPVRQSYGMTEIGSTLNVPMEAGAMSGSGSCGLPAPYRQCMIADESGQPVPHGEIGELCVAGPGMLHGYYKKPEATANAFWGDKWFRTGDLFRQDADGYYYIVGRIKDMIRRSGENVSAIQVQAALALMPEIQEAAVIGVKDLKRGEEVKACVVLKPGVGLEAVPPERIVAHCAGHLAPFKVPRYVQYFHELPRTGSNKVAKKVLADGGGRPSTSTYDRVGGRWA